MTDWIGVDVGKRTCVVGGCEKPRGYAQGWCSMHYQRWTQHGSLDKPAKRVKRAPGPCSVDGCNEPTSAKSMCGKHYKADHHQQHKQGEAERQQARRDADRPSYLALSRAYYMANRGAVLARMAERYAEDPEPKIRKTAEWREANPAKRREFEMRRRARKRGNRVTKADYAAILAEFGMACHICTLEIESMADLHFDHVIPLAKGGPHIRANIEPAHAVCNMRKHTRLLA